MKKRGFGKNKYNGFGGKVKDNEDIKQAAIRELFEETVVRVHPKNFEKKGDLIFLFPYEIGWNQKVHIFVAESWEGKPIETEEMKPEWFDFKDIPFEKMWNDDVYWLPKILNGKNLKGEFIFGKDNETIINVNVKEF